MELWYIFPLLLGLLLSLYTMIKKIVNYYKTSVVNCDEKGIFIVNFTSRFLYNLN
jgi:hypothetical protein